MSTQQGPRHETYERVRSDFDHLEMEEKARFLVEATVSTMARGIEAAGRVLADEIDEILRTCARPRKEAQDEETEASEVSPEEPDEKASTKGKKKTNGKKSSTSEKKNDDAD